MSPASLLITNSRRTFESILRSTLIACVSARKKGSRDIDSGLEFVGFTTGAGQIAHPAAHPELVPIVLSSTDLV